MKDILGYLSMCSVLKEWYNIWYKVNLENEISFTQEFARLKTVVWKKYVGGCELVISGNYTFLAHIEPTNQFDCKDGEMIWETY